MMSKSEEIVDLWVKAYFLYLKDGGGSGRIHPIARKGLEEMIHVALKDAAATNPPKPKRAPRKRDEAKEDSKS